MTPWLILTVAVLYFAALFTIAWWTSRRADDSSYYLGNRSSRWWVVAFGLIGDSMSGASYISVPGKVAASRPGTEAGFGYFQMVLGYVLGYVVIAEVLVPLYYRLNLTSIYGYLGNRFGLAAQRTGAGFFVLSRLMGAAARLLLAARVFQEFVFGPLHVPFAVTVGGIIVLILGYTVRGGIRTLVWTDTLQSAFLVAGVVVSLLIIGHDLGLGVGGLFSHVAQSDLSRVFDWDWRSKSYFWKQFLSGAAITVVMTGLDQNNMQKNLSCPSPRDARKNLYAFAVVMLPVNLFFLSMGVLLAGYARAHGLAAPAHPDQLFPMLALQHLGTVAAVVFVVGLTAATFNSADSVLTTLTTSFCFDFLGFGERRDLTEEAKTRRRRWVHVGFAFVLMWVILALQTTGNASVIDLVLSLASYTYGPLLGLFVLGLATRVRVAGPWVPVVACLAPVACWLLSRRTEAWLNGYRMGTELLLLNAALTMGGLALLARVPGGGAGHAAGSAGRGA